MTFYQELQLNQEGSKSLIRSCSNRKEKLRHISVYLFKIFITMVFCMAFVMGYSSIFGDENSIVGVIVLLCIMVFRYADFGMKMSGSLASLAIIFGILAFGPRLANAAGLFGELAINAFCIFVLLLLGCHNVMMANHSTLVLGYLLLYGYDITGNAYLMRLAAIGTGAVLTGLVFYRNHRKLSYKRTLRGCAEGIFHSFSPFPLAAYRIPLAFPLLFFLAVFSIFQELCGLELQQCLSFFLSAQT